MRIAVYCGSVSGNDPTHAQIAEALGKMIGERGHQLVYGGSHTGLMGIVANTAMANGAEAIGVIPNVKLIHERVHEGLTECIRMDTMSARKDKMIELSDAYIALPGGYGTLDEISDILCLTRLELIDKPIVLVNANGYYDALKVFFDKMTETGYVGSEEMENVLFSDDVEAIARHIEGYCKK